MCTEDTYYFVFCHMYYAGAKNFADPNSYTDLSRSILKTFEGPRECLRTKRYDLSGNIGIIAVNCADPAALRHLLSLMTVFQSEHFYRYGTLFRGKICQGSLTFGTDYAQGMTAFRALEEIENWKSLPRIIVDDEFAAGIDDLVKFDNDGIRYLDYISRLQSMLLNPDNGFHWIPNNKILENNLVRESVEWINNKLLH